MKKVIAILYMAVGAGMIVYGFIEYLKAKKNASEPEVEPPMEEESLIVNQDPVKS